MKMFIDFKCTKTIGIITCNSGSLILCFNFPSFLNSDLLPQVEQTVLWKRFLLSLSQTTWLLSPETAVVSVGLSRDALHTQADMYTEGTVEFVCTFLCYSRCSFPISGRCWEPAEPKLPCWRQRFAAEKVLSRGCSTHHFSTAQLFFSGLHSGPLLICTPVGPEPLRVRLQNNPLCSFLVKMAVQMLLSPPCSCGHKLRRLCGEVLA